MTLRDAAQRYARAGWAVLPLRPGEKAPASAHGVKDASTDYEVINGWWDGWWDDLDNPEAAPNIGIATGSASGVVVIDIDRIDDETQAFIDELPATATVKTPKGLHLYFEAPGGGLPNSAGKLAKGIDTRGDGGYVLAPPSVLADGRRYEWVSKTRPAPLPAWVLEKLTARPEPVGDDAPFGRRLLGTAAAS